MAIMHLDGIQRGIRKKKLDEHFNNVKNHLQKVIVRQNLLIEAKKFDKIELQEITAYLWTDNSDCLIELEKTKNVLSNSKRKVIISEIRQFIIAKLEVEILTRTKIFKDIHDILEHNSTYVDNPHGVLQELEKWDTIFEQLIMRIHGFKINDFINEKQQEIGAITQFEIIIGQVDTFLQNIEFTP